MVLLAFLGIGAVLGLLASLILREDGYEVFGEVVIGVLGALVFGVLASIRYGMEHVTIQVLLASALGSALVLGAVVTLTLWIRGGRSATATRADHTRAGLEELRAEGFGLVLPVAVIPAGCLVLFVVDSTRPETWLPPFGLVVVAVLAYLALRLSLLSAGLVLLTGLSLTLYSAVTIYSSYSLASLYALVVILAGVLLGPVWGIAWAVISTGIVTAGTYLFGTIQPEVATTAYLAIWGSAVLAWLASIPVYTALEWSWSSYVQSLGTTEELKERQGELTSALKGLSEAYYRLEKTNEELDRARKAATEARRLKAQFAANLSHELRTPLNLIVGFSETMLMAPHAYGNETLPPTYRGDVEAIFRNAQHLSTLIDDVLDLSQIEAGRMGLSKEPCGIADIIAEAASVVRKRFDAKDLELVVDVPAGLPGISVDRTRVRQVLINLLNNAVRFTERGAVRIKATGDDRELVVAVSDTGIGIRPEDLPQVFQEFHQFGSAVGRQHDGSGLGLSISKRFVELHGGSMWVESEAGRGSTFYFTLPFADRVVSISARQDWETWARIQPASEQQGERRLAVVTEDQRTLGLFKRYLSGYRVVPALEVARARKTEESGTTHAVVVCGSRAWVDSGAWRQAQAAYSGVPVVVCSLTSGADAGRELGVARYLTKPVAREQLLEALRALRKQVHSIAVIDDDPEVVDLLVRMLKSARRRYQLLSATDGEEGLRMLRDRQPDAVLLDLLMPGTDGYAVLARMRADEALKDIPVIVITAKGYESEAIMGEVMSVTRSGGLNVGQLMASVRTTLDNLLSSPDISEPLSAGPAA